MAFKDVQAQIPPSSLVYCRLSRIRKKYICRKNGGPKLVVDSITVSPKSLISTMWSLSTGENKSDNVDQIESHLCIPICRVLEFKPLLWILCRIISPLTIQAMIDKEKGEANLMNGFKEKALAMRQLIDAIMRWGTDCLWIYHLHDLEMERPKNTATTVSQTKIVSSSMYQCPT